MRLNSNRRLTKSKRLLFTSALGAAAMTLALASCASGPPAKPKLTPTERVRRDQALGAGLARQFEAKLRFKQDKQVILYLHEVTARLSSGVEELKTSAVSVQVLADRGERWSSYALPGNRLYLSSGALRGAEFENQLAALIALELAHLTLRHVPLRLEETRSEPGASTPADFPSIEGLVPTADSSSRAVDFFGPTGLFAFPDEYFVDAVETAVGILYRGGFDPRGLVSLWELYRAHPANSPLESEILGKLIEKTRTVIAVYPPLRNPIVRSPAFIAIQKRIKKL
jgi:predicted Zn-dependent protease